MWKHGKIWVDEKKNDILKEKKILNRSNLENIYEADFFQTSYLVQITKKPFNAIILGDYYLDKNQFNTGSLV